MTSIREAQWYAMAAMGDISEHTKFRVLLRSVFNELLYELDLEIVFKPLNFRKSRSQKVFNWQIKRHILSEAHHEAR